MAQLGLRTVHDPRDWRELVEAALVQEGSEGVGQRVGGQQIFQQCIRDAQDAVMEELEDTFQTARPTERQSLINAINALREQRRLKNAEHRVLQSPAA